MNIHSAKPLVLQSIDFVFNIFFHLIFFLIIQLCVFYCWYPYYISYIIILNTNPYCIHPKWTRNWITHPNQNTNTTLFYLNLDATKQIRHAIECSMWIFKYDRNYFHEAEEKMLQWTRLITFSSRSVFVDWNQRCVMGYIVQFKFV